MIRSLMPKGVEHQKVKRELVKVEKEVIRSLMPKGVEHPFTWKFLALTCAVIRSLMPKGVEHKNIDMNVTCNIRDSIFDAERR